MEGRAETGAAAHPGGRDRGEPAGEPAPRGAAGAVRLGSLAGAPGFLLRLAQLRVWEDWSRAFPDDAEGPAVFSTLHVIALNPGLRQGALARALRIKPAHMTKLVRGLEDRGLVRRRIPEDDRRAVALDLTEAGRSHVAARAARFEAVNRALPPGLGPAERDALVALLRRVAGFGGGGEGGTLGREDAGEGT